MVHWKTQSILQTHLSLGLAVNPLVSKTIHCSTSSWTKPKWIIYPQIRNSQISHNPLIHQTHILSISVYVLLTFWSLNTYILFLFLWCDRFAFISFIQHHTYLTFLGPVYNYSLLLQSHNKCPLVSFFGPEIISVLTLTVQGHLLFQMR